MTYETQEQTQATGAPFECYEFQSPAGTFRYTSRPVNVTLGGEVFTPLQIGRTSFAIGQVIDGVKTMDFQLPLGNEVAEEYASVIMPEYLTVLVYRAHVGEDHSDSDNYKIEWRGEAVMVGVENDAFVIKTQSILAAKALNGLNTVFYQYNCNNRVYDTRCGLLESNFRVDTTADFIDNILVTVGSIGAYDGLLSLGKMINQRTDEQRSITGNSSTIITLNKAFRDIVVGDSVYLVLGCDNRRTTCFNRFSNMASFNGFPYIPAENPFAE